MIASNQRSSSRIAYILGGVVAFLCLCAAAFFGLNAAISANFNATVTTLNNNVAALQKDSDELDIEALEDSQTQVDAQLADITSTAFFHLPSVTSSLDQATSLSRKLDDTIAALKKKQSETSSHDVTLNPQTSEGDTTADTGSDSESAGDAQKEAQQKKLEALLKQNETSEENGTTGTGNSTTTSPDTSTSKPW